jgi:hypothetical protein
MREREYKNDNKNELPAPSSTNSRRRRRRKEVGKRGSWKSKWELRMGFKREEDVGIS